MFDAAISLSFRYTWHLCNHLSTRDSVDYSNKTLCGWKRKVKIKSEKTQQRLAWKKKNVVKKKLKPWIALESPVGKNEYIVEVVRLQFGKKKIACSSEDFRCVCKTWYINYFFAYCNGNPNITSFKHMHIHIHTEYGWRVEFDWMTKNSNWRMFIYHWQQIWWFGDLLIRPLFLSLWLRASLTTKPTWNSTFWIDNLIEFYVRAHFGHNWENENITSIRHPGDSISFTLFSFYFCSFISFQFAENVFPSEHSNIFFFFEVSI